MKVKIPCRRAWQPTPAFLPGEFHGQRSLAGYSPWGPEESDMTEQLHFHFSLSQPFPFYTEDSGSEKLSDPPKVTQLKSSIVMVLLYVPLLSFPYGLALNHDEWAATLFTCSCTVHRIL